MIEWKRIAVVAAWMCLGAMVQPLCAQSWKVRGEVSLAGGREWNVYHSPETYLANGDSAWVRDSLVVHDALVEPSVRWTARRQDDHGRWRVSLDGDMRRYGQQRDADRTGLQLRVERVHRLGDDVDLIAAGRLRQERRLGLNILGNELLTSFSFFQAQADIRLEWRPHPAWTWSVGGEAFSKDYQDRVTGVSLDQDEKSVETEVVWNPGKVNRGTRGLEMVGAKRAASNIRWSASYEYRDKPYRNWVNEDLLADVVLPMDTTPFLPFDTALVGTYPTRHWAYSTWRLRCDLPLREGWSWRVDLRRQNRTDRSRGDFGYEDVKVSSRFKWAPKASAWSAAMTASRTWRNYTHRLAEQALGAPYPTLNYRYTRLDAELERAVGDRGAIVALFDLTVRGSNTTAEDRRTRRGYRTGAVLIGYRMSF